MGIFVALTWAQEQGQDTGNVTSGEKVSAAVKPESDENIVPIVIARPGQVKEFFFTTECTLGITRSAGLSVSEMVDGKLVSFSEKEYDRDGIAIKVSDYREATEFNSSSQFAPLAEKGLGVFKVTISIDPRAKPTFKDVHLADATCSGHCKTDFRIFVVNDPKSGEK